MKYWSYNTGPFENSIGGEIKTLSEDEIINEYYPYWYDQMCKKFGKDMVDKNYCEADCIDDWVIVNWAWLVEDE